MTKWITELFLVLSLYACVQEAEAFVPVYTHLADRRGGGGDGGHAHHNQPSNFNPAPIYNTWDYDSPRSVYTPAPLPVVRPYVPAGSYRSLFPEDRLPPDVPDYPATSLYIPTFTMSTDTPMVKMGEDINVSIDVDKGSPPYIVYWNYNNSDEWVMGTTSFTRKADKKGVITITALVKDLNEQISHPQSIQVIVLQK